MPPKRVRSASATAAGGAAAAAQSGDELAATAVARDPKEDTGARPCCWICLEQASDDDGPLLRGCACRGNDSGWVHVECIVKGAQANEKLWRICPTCRQRFTGKLFLQLARERYRLSRLPSSAAAPAEPGEWERDTAAMYMLTHALSEMGEHTEAVRIGRDLVAACRSRYGDASERTLRATLILASAYHDLGDLTSALPLQVEGLAEYRRLYGNDDPDTLNCIAHLASMRTRMGHFDAALSLYDECLTTGRRVLSADDPGLHAHIHSTAILHTKMGKYDMALPLMQEALTASHQLLGRQHPHTLRSVGSVGQIYCKMGDFGAGRPMLEEAAAGTAALYSETHTEVRHWALWVQCAAKGELGEKTTALFCPLFVQNDHFTKTGSGQT
jgi:tetratricopeptide (TPR) repeat protein